MKTQQYLSRFNWRQVLIHSCASLFFIAAFYTFTFLYNTTLLIVIKHMQAGSENAAMRTGTLSSADYINFVRLPSYGAMIGLLVAFFISLFLSLKRRWYWLNSVVAYLVVYIGYRFILAQWSFFWRLLSYPGRIFSNLFAMFLTSGLLMLVIGVLLFFLKPSMLFIEKGRFDILTNKSNSSHQPI